MPARRLITLPVLAVAAAVAADRLLHDAPLGLGAALLVLLAGTGLLHRRPAGASAWIVVATATLLLLLDPGPLAVLFAILALTATSLLAGGWRPTGPAQALGATAASLLRALARTLRDLHLLHRLPGAGRGMIVRWIVPLLGAAIFIGIFAIANPILAGRISDLGTWLSACDLPGPGRIMLWWLTATGLWMLARARNRPSTATTPIGGYEPPTDWTLRCLVAFNLAFLVQNACDAAYLWGGTALPTGLTYASYAHRGAYPLVVAALLAGAFVLACVRPGGAAERSPMARVLVLGFLVQTVVLTISAWWRLDLYVDIYGLSRWRLATLAWMALVALGLALIGWRILRHLGNTWLVERNAWAVAVVLAVAAVGDLDGLIARHNVDRALTGEGPASFDLEYCAGLGPAALPALVRYDAAVHTPESAAAVGHLTAELHAGLTDWRGLTLRRWLTARHTGR